MIRNGWGDQLKRVFDSLANPLWDAPSTEAPNVLSSLQAQSQPVRLMPPQEVKALPSAE